MKGRLLLLLFVVVGLWSFPHLASASFTLLQETATVTTCNTNCTLAVPYTKPGSLLVLTAFDASGANRFISSFSGAGTSVAPSACQKIGLPGSISCAYVLSSTAAVTSVNVTMSGNMSFGRFYWWEISYTTGPVALDSTNATSSSASTTPLGQVLTLSGVNDVIIQQVGVSSGSLNAVTTYTNLVTSSQTAEAVLLNTTSGAAPTWTNSTNTASLVSGIAFKEIGVITPVLSPPAGLYSHNLPLLVTVTSGTSGTTIIYTTDGTTPTADASCVPINGTQYSSAVSISASQTVNAIACKVGLVTSSASTATYTLTVTQGTWNGIPVGGSSGTINSLNTISSSNNAWNNLSYPTGIGSFSLVQTGHCALSSGTTCSIPVSPALAPGNLHIFSCNILNSTAFPKRYISSVSAGGTLISAVGASNGGHPSTSLNNSFAYILPSTSTGGGSPVVITLNQAPTAASSCYLAEYKPSDYPENVGLDIDGLFQPVAAATTVTSPNLTLSAVNDVIFRGFSLFKTYVHPTAVTSPYNASAYLTRSNTADGYAGYSVATPSNGDGPTWTSSSVIPNLSSLAFGWNPASCKQQTFLDFESGTSGTPVTVSTLATSTHGWQGGYWNIPAAPTMKFDTGFSMPLQNATGRLCADGSNYPAGAGSKGISITGAGTNTRDFIEYRFDYNFKQPVTSLGFWYHDTFAATDQDDIDCADIYGTGDFAAVNCYGNGSFRFIQLETPQGNSVNNIPITPGGTYYIQLVYRAGGHHSISVWNTSGTLVGSSSSPNNGNGNYPILWSVGWNNGNVNFTNGKKMYFDSVKFSLNGDDPIGQ